jgi:hypothetical protein
MGWTRGSIGKFAEGAGCFSSSIDWCVGNGSDKSSNVFVTRDASRATEFLRGRGGKDLR